MVIVCLVSCLGLLSRKILVNLYMYLLKISSMKLGQDVCAKICLDNLAGEL